MIRAFIFLSFITYSQWAFTQVYSPVNDIDAVKNRIQQVSQNTNSLQSEFSQIKSSAFLNEPALTQGIFKFKKEDKIRWEYTEPFQYIVILNDGNLFINDEGKKNKMNLAQNIMFKKISKMISRAMTGELMNEEKDFSVRLEESEEIYRISLTPLKNKMQNYLERVEVLFHKKSCLVSEVLLVEGADEFTQIKFLSMKSNEEINNKEFLIN